MKIAPLFFYLSFLLVSNFAYTQYKEPIDTSNIPFRDELEKEFESRLLKPEAIKGLFVNENASLELSLIHI